MQFVTPVWPGNQHSLHENYSRGACSTMQRVCSFKHDPSLRSMPSTLFLAYLSICWIYIKIKAWPRKWFGMENCVSVFWHSGYASKLVGITARYLSNHIPTLLQRVSLTMANIPRHSVISVLVEKKSVVRKDIPGKKWNKFTCDASTTEMKWIQCSIQLKIP